MTDAELRDNWAAKFAATGFYFVPKNAQEAIFKDGWDAARATPDPRVEKLVEALRQSSETLSAVYETTEAWTLEQERLANRAICSLMISQIDAVLAEWEKGAHETR